MVLIPYLAGNDPDDGTILGGSGDGVLIPYLAGNDPDDGHACFGSLPERLNTLSRG